MITLYSVLKEPPMAFTRHPLKKLKRQEKHKKWARFSGKVILLTKDEK